MPPRVKRQNRKRPEPRLREISPESTVAVDAVQLPDEVQRLRQIVDSQMIATFVIDQNHVVTHWNKACEQLTGIPALQMIGTNRPWIAFYPNDRPVLADLILDGASEKVLQQYYYGKCRQSVVVDGAYEADDFFPTIGETGRWLYFTAAPFRTADGRIIGAIETLQDFTTLRRAEAALKQSEERYRQLSITDSLTGLFNARHFYDELKSEVARTMRHGNPLSLMLIDVDHFKRLNDEFGHGEGDRVLECLADSIRRCLRGSDSAYRLGGDEFVALLPETELDSAHRVAERLRVTFAARQQKIATDKLSTNCSLSIGVTRYKACEALSDFVRRADSGTYQAKHQGRDCVVLVTP